MTILPKVISRFNAIPIKLPMTLFTQLGDTILKFIWNQKWAQIAKAVLSKKDKVGAIILLDFKLYSYSNQNSMMLIQKQTHRPMEQSREPEIKPQTYTHLIFDKADKNKQWRKGSLFNKWCWNNWLAIHKRMTLNPFLSSYTKIKSKWIKYLIPQTIRILEENLGNILLDNSVGKEFIAKFSKANATKTNIDKWHLIKLRSFCTAK